MADDPGIDCIPSGDPTLDYSEMREGVHPSQVPAFGPREAAQVVDAVRTLSQREFRLKIVVEDADSGVELWWIRPDIRARIGQTIKLELPLTLETS